MNINKKQILGIDVGGSHISAAVVDVNTGQFYVGSYQKIDIDATCKPDEFVLVLSNLIGDYVKSTKIEVVGFSFPGPLNYDKGIVQISGLAKYTKLFGLNLKKTLATIVNKKIDYLFENDAGCFTIGSYFQSKSKKYSRILGITLGTGFGSTFLIDGKTQKAIKGVPKNGFLYSEKFKSSIADNYFSTRWLIKRFFELSGVEISGGKVLHQLALSGNRHAEQVFYEFGESLALFLKPYLDGFEPDNLVIGGNIAKAWGFISESFNRNVNKGKLKISISANSEHAAIIGAASLFMLHEISPEIIPLNYRQTKQFPAPQKAGTAPKDDYDIYPSFSIGDDKIGRGYEGIANWISEKQTVVLDGYIAVFWDNIINRLNHYFIKKGLKVFWFDVSSALKPATEINQLILPYMGKEDSIFGKRCEKSLSDFFCKDQLNQIANANEPAITIIYGCGASLVKKNSPLIYFDLPKNEIQFRSRAAQVQNLGSITLTDSKTMYKRFYFVDWPVLNKHKQQILPEIDLLVDEQNPENPVFIKGDDFRNSLTEISRNYFRVRPWFEPGAWGGQWMKEKIPGLSPDVPNYAWSFELIVPENGIMLKSNDLLLEFSFDFLMYQEAENVLGEANKRFGTDFPIRFDFLDTFEGGNLSIQCHPRPKYMKEQFGEDFTQDESYYILDTKDNAEVYLGFRDNIEPIEFRKALEESSRMKTAVDIEKFVQKHPAKKHDLFLIPNGTIHGSGINNLVLEISSTPYIFTFKMYDWLRLDLDGKPRPINIDHAFKNLYFDYKGKKIKDEFISKPKIIKKGKDWQIMHLPTHPNHFYDVERFEFSNFIEAKTNNQSHIFMLVEGKSLMLETKNGRKQQFNYAETFVVPAAAESYKLINKSKTEIKVVKAFVKGF